MSSPPRGQKRERFESVGGDDRYKSRRTQDEPISTLHLSGLPADIKERELRNLGIFLPGFEDSTVNRSRGTREKESTTITGFMKFVNPKAAMAALQALQGHNFDPSDERALLRVSMAKRNMNVSSFARNNPSRAPMPAMPFNPYVPMPGFEAYDGAAAAVAYYGYDMGAPSYEVPAASPMGCPVTISTRGNPCDTLCAQGITPFTQQADLEPLFTNLAGYSDMKVLTSKGIGFVKFENEADALAALEKLSGTTVALPGADSRTSIRLEYAKRSLEVRPPSRREE